MKPFLWNRSIHLKKRLSRLFLVVVKIVVSVQVSVLEQQLERTRAALQDEVRNKERELQEKDKVLQEMTRQNAQLSESIK